MHACVNMGCIWSSPGGTPAQMGRTEVSARMSGWLSRLAELAVLDKAYLCVLKVVRREVHRHLHGSAVAQHTRSTAGSRHAAHRAAGRTRCTMQKVPRGTRTSPMRTSACACRNRIGSTDSRRWLSCTQQRRYQLISVHRFSGMGLLSVRHQLYKHCEDIGHIV